MSTTTATTRQFSFADDLPISLDLTNHKGDVAVVLDAPEGTAEVTLNSPRPVDFDAVRATSQRGRVTIDIPALVDPEAGRGMAFSLGRFTLGHGHEPVHVEVHLPHGADLSVSTKAGDVVLQGVCGTTRARTGAGDLTIEETGSLQASTGWGDIRVGLLTGGSVSTGAGDITIDTAAGPGELAVRTGAGDVSVTEGRHDITIATGSGDVVAGHHQGRFTARTGTGDVEVTVPRGIPTWLDLSSGLGDVRRELESVGAPAQGQEHLSLTVRTGTGDVRVHH